METRHQVNMKILKLIQLSIVLSLMLFSNIQAETISLPATCQTIPNKEIKVCFIITKPENNLPYDEIVFYKEDHSGILSLLGSEVEHGIFHGFTFSPQGKYLYLKWTEEGHPNFQFYLVDDYINNWKTKNLLDSIDDLQIENIVKFKDSGDVIYALSDEFNEANKVNDTSNRTIFQNLKSVNDKHRYYKYFNLE